jgi:DNA-binding transcriptional ArsR family regulator
MVVDHDADLVFHALADATRRDIVRNVLRDERSVSDLARRYPMSFAAIQKHVAVLERAHLVTKRRHGREQLVRANPAALRPARAVLDELESRWRTRIATMDRLLAEEEPTA